MIGMRGLARGVLLIPVAALAGCLAAAAAGAGGAIVLTGHTAEAIVERPVEDVAAVAEEVLRDEEIEVTDTRTEDRGERRVYEGVKGDLDVTVTIEREEAGTQVGAEAIVEQPVEDVAAVAEEVLRDEEIEVTDTRTEDRGERRVYEGVKGDLDVTVTIEREEAGTQVGAEAQRGPASWDDDYARTLLAEIIERTGE